MNEMTGWVIKGSMSTLKIRQWIDTWLSGWGLGVCVCVLLISV